MIFLAIPMRGNLNCAECQAIAQELAEAYAATWDSADRAFGNAWIATYRMIGGTEEDAEGAEELISHAQNRNAPRIHRALHRMFMHEAIAGHKVRAGFDL